MKRSGCCLMRVEKVFPLAIAARMGRWLAVVVVHHRRLECDNASPCLESSQSAATTRSRAWSRRNNQRHDRSAAAPSHVVRPRSSPATRTAYTSGTWLPETAAMSSAKIWLSIKVTIVSYRRLLATLCRASRFVECFSLSKRVRYRECYFTECGTRQTIFYRMPDKNHFEHSGKSQIPVLTPMPARRTYSWVPRTTIK